MKSGQQGSIVQRGAGPREMRSSAHPQVCHLHRERVLAAKEKSAHTPGVLPPVPLFLSVSDGLGRRIPESHCL